MCETRRLEKILEHPSPNHFIKLSLFPFYFATLPTIGTPEQATLNFVVVSLNPIQNEGLWVTPGPLA